MPATAGPLPVLVVVSGPAGSGKTTLARELAGAVGCPAICRDEIKQGMAHVTPGFVPAAGDELTLRTLPVFFGVLELLLRAGVTTVADAAFQDKIWRSRLEPLRRLARIRIVQCVVDADVAMDRILRRSAADPLRRCMQTPAGTSGRRRHMPTRRSTGLRWPPRRSRSTPPTATGRGWPTSPRLSAARAERSYSPGGRRPKAKYDSGTAPSEFTRMTAVAQAHFLPRIWSVGRRLMSISAAAFRHPSATPTATIILRVRSLRSLHFRRAVVAMVHPSGTGLASAIAEISSYPTCAAAIPVISA